MLCCMPCHSSVPERAEGGGEGASQIQRSKIPAGHFRAKGTFCRREQSTWLGVNRDCLVKLTTDSIREGKVGYTTILNQCRREE